MNQVKHPATGWRNLLICTRRSMSPAPCLARRSPACLTPGRQSGNKGAGEDAVTAPKRREAAAGDKAHSPAAMGVRNAPARPIVWGPLCSSTPLVPNHRGRYIGSRTEMALLKEALMCKKPPGPGPAVRACLAHGPTLLPQRAGRSPLCCPKQPSLAQSRGPQTSVGRWTQGLFLCAHRAQGSPMPSASCSPRDLSLQCLWKWGAVPWSGREAPED